MDHNAQKQYFEIAYRTGSDVWTHIHYHPIALRMLPPLPANSFILDVGAGRGLWMRKLVEEGYRVIGVDYISDVIKHGNSELKFHHMEDRARFIHGDVRDIPLADNSFDAVTDIGVLQHMDPADWGTYAAEISRVLKQNGYLLNVSLSKETQRFLGLRPKSSPDSQFEKFGVSYYFFTNSEVSQIFSKQGFVLVDQHIEHFDAKTDPLDAISLVFSLFKKV